MGASVGITRPYMSYLGVMAHLTFLDLLRVYAGGGLVRALISNSTNEAIKEKAYSYGYGALLRIPTLMVSPIVGLEWSTYWRDDGANRTKYLSPLAGFEIRFSFAIIGFGALAPRRKSAGGSWKAKKEKSKILFIDDEEKERDFWAPFAYVGVEF